MLKPITKTCILSDNCDESHHNFVLPMNVGDTISFDDEGCESVITKKDFDFSNGVLYIFAKP